MKFWYLSVATAVWSIAAFGILMPLLAWGLSYPIGDVPAVTAMYVLSPVLASLPLLIPSREIAARYAAASRGRYNRNVLFLVNQLMAVMALALCEVVLLIGVNP
ncbi:hypothetical protein ['Paenibacillus yunnanensis' Narsing Rao et al. 2020]|uniref:hypothetical protein n=1 Tax=Paenibacillus tengchongensis TaxID=2608684 RepID=UPI001651F794|nr:hypothetical protein [Paenibacillus tengchongensis]